MRLLQIVALLMLVNWMLLGQESSDRVTGVVIGLEADGSTEPLVGANVVWLGSNQGTVTEVDGSFALVSVADATQLVISYVGFSPDTVTVAGQNLVEVMLVAGNVLQDVKVVHRQKATEVSFLNPLKVEKITEKELLKAACCNLSESFETSPSVDVAFTDAITGTRQIQMLGLAGPYLQITRESMPFVRGLASNYGLTFVPGTWVDGMQLNKGAGTVVNGFESISGQINIELRKPEKTEKLYLNLYANESGRLEANANLAFQLDEKWSTGILLHGNRLAEVADRNADGFRDMPTTDHFIAMNRWKFMGSNGLRFQAGIKTTAIDNVGGHVDFESGSNGGRDLWGLNSRMRRLEAWTKLGKVYEALPWRSWAIQLMMSNHEDNSSFGRRVYDARHQTLYANFLYQSIIGNTNHQVLMGLSFLRDQYEESLDDAAFDRTEAVPGGFFEYTFGGHEKFSAVLGARADHHNNYGLFFTPRVHLRYAFTDDLVVRASGGKGLRTANLIAENLGLLASSRAFVFGGEDPDTPYGMQPEVAWNYGANLVQTFLLNGLPGSLTFDLYRTQFSNQVVVDLDANPQMVRFYNLQGKSYSNSFQAQLDYEVLTRLDLRFAYRWYDVKTTFGDQLRSKPLVSKHRFFANVAYATANGWAFDYTFNWQGRKRIPNTASNPEEFRLPTASPSFSIMHAQVTKAWEGGFEVYVGMENILDYRQEDAILASEAPFSQFFDASLVWGPIFGRNTYIGLRYRI